MIFISQTLFWIIIAIGLLCALGALATHLWYKRLSQPTENQNKLQRILFPGFFFGFLIFGITPLFFLLLPIIVFI